MESDEKLSSLESEVNIVKGEVKALLIDIREIMNNMENPFYNIRSTTDGPDTPPDTGMRGEDAPMGSIPHEDMLEQKPQPELVEMPVQEEEMQQMDAGPAPNVAATPVQQGVPMPQVPMQQMGGTPEPYHPGFAEMPVQHDGAKQEATPEHAPDFTEMFKQYGEAKQSGDDGTTQEAIPEHAPDFAEMFKQYGEAKQSEGNGAGQAETAEHAPDFTEMPVQDEIPELVPDFTEVPVQHEGVKQSEEMLEETPEIQPDNGFDIYTLAELMRWADYTLATIERSKLDMLLDLYVLTGHIPETLKDIISKITDLSNQEIAEGSASTMQDHISAMFQLNAILGTSESDQKAIYSIYGELPWRKVM